MAITAATPIMIPSMVNTLRKAFAASARQALRNAAHALIPELP
jgi:hypothetical protein